MEIDKLDMEIMEKTILISFSLFMIFCIVLFILLIIKAVTSYKEEKLYLAKKEWMKKSCDFIKQINLINYTDEAPKKFFKGNLENDFMEYMEENFQD